MTASAHSEPTLAERLADPAGDSVDEWFAELADRLLNRSLLVARRVSLRIREVEFYLRGPGHEDPFAHADPGQLASNRWYLHRTGGGLRNGSFKGIDLAFGPDDTHGGILVRSLQLPDGRVVNGSSKCVDLLLERTGTPDVHALHDALHPFAADDSTGTVHLRDDPEPRTDEPLRTSRVGLTLKRAHRHGAMPRYLCRPYRFLTGPRDIRKGRVPVLIALHEAGRTAEEIRERTGSPRRAVERTVAEYDAGLRETSFDPYLGRSLDAGELARVHGLWRATFG